MSVTSGFFNSVNGDRRYTAEQFSDLISTLIIDGVFSNVGTAFAVNADSGSNITVGIGRAWFNGTWIYNDALLPMTVRSAEILLDRIDAVVIEVNHSETVRAASIRFVNGVPSSSDPQRPELTNTDEVHQYPLAYIYRKAGNDNVVQADITNMIGTSACPYVIGILDTQNIDKLIAQWDSEFNIWFEGLEGILSGDIAGNLALRILELEDKFRVLAEEKAVYQDLQDASGDLILDRNGGNIEGRTSMTGDSSGSYSNYYEEIERIYKTIQDVDSIDKTMKVGDVRVCMSISQSDKWLLCNGAKLSRTEYPELNKLYPELPNAKTWSIASISSYSQSNDYAKLQRHIVNDSYILLACPTGDGVNICLSTKFNTGWTSYQIYTTTAVSSNKAQYMEATDMLYANGYYLATIDDWCGWNDGPRINPKAIVAVTTDPSNSSNWVTKTLWTAGYHDTHTAAARKIAFCNGYYIVVGWAEIDSNNVAIKLAYATNPMGTWTTKTIVSYSTSTPNMLVSNMIYADGKYILAYYIHDGSTYKTRVVYSDSLDGDWTTLIEYETSYNFNLLYTDDGIILTTDGLITETSGTQWNLAVAKTLSELTDDSNKISVANLGGFYNNIIFNEGIYIANNGPRYGENIGFQINYTTDIRSKKWNNETAATNTSWLSTHRSLSTIVYGRNAFSIHGGETYPLLYIDTSEITIPSISVDNAYAYIKVKE